MGSIMSKVQLCTVYKKEFITDFAHDMSDMYTEIFVPNKKIIIRLLNKDGLVYVFKSSEAQTKQECIHSLTNHIGKVNDIREMYIDNSWIDACIMNYESTKIIKDKMPGF